MCQQANSIRSRFVIIKKQVKQISLQHKILAGYVILVAVIGSMAATLLYERNRVVGIESEMKRIHRVQHDVNTAHRYITLLAMRGETAIAWEKEDFEDYRSLRLRVDTMLQTMQSGSEEFVSRVQIDTLRHLLASKSKPLFIIEAESIVILAPISQFGCLNA